MLILLIFLDQIIKIYIKTHFKLGQSLKIFNWLKLIFNENPGIGYGFNLKYGYLEKLIISIIRIILIINLKFFYKKNCSYKISICLLLAGAISNLIDCLFYGIIFNKGVRFINHSWNFYEGISNIFSKKGYSFFLCGCVVDMFYVKLLKIKMPNYIPLFRNVELKFLNVIFNLADLFIFLGVIIFCLFLPRLDLNQRPPD
ncbi:signal peptidase II [Candidatus Karelsulcia muelleri]|uniref:signal peptidase II n=1 Tax=Candidatus Karelsulcia muelleri TaxID=336810 RepID=UPI000D7CD09C|nr:signal peptidase II [Candidatus Karelsulcia muelleri]